MPHIFDEPTRRMPSKIMRYLLVIPLLLSVASSGYAASSPQSEQASLIQLLATPERYDGKLVNVTGFVNIEFEGTAIWLHKDGFDNSIYANSLWVEVSECNDNRGRPMSGYASLMGRFSTQRKGHMGLWPGQIEQIGSCWPSPRVGT